MAPRRPMKGRKCRYFDYDGSALQGGCNRRASVCPFIHPSDPEWNFGYPRILDSRSPIHRRGSPNRSRSRSPRRRYRHSTPPRHTRRPSSRESERRDRPSDFSPGRSSSIASSSRVSKRDSTVVQPPRRASTGIDIDQTPQEPSSSSVPSLPKEASQPTSSSPSTAISASPLPSMPPPPLPTTHATVSSPAQIIHPPPSDVQAGSTEEHPPTQQESPLANKSPEEKRAIWLNRVKLVTDSCAARAEHMKWEMEVCKCKSLLKCKLVDMVDAESKSRLEEDLAIATGKCDSLKADINATVQKILELDDFWPRATNSDTSLTAQTLEKLHSEVKELKSYADGIQRQVDDVQQAASSTLTGAKRKRSMMDDGEPDRHQDDRSFDQIDDRIKELEGRLVEHENDLYQCEEDLLSSLSEKIDEKVEDFVSQRRKKEEVLRQQETEEADIIAGIKAKLQVTEDNVSKMRHEIEQMIENTSVLEETARKLIQDDKELDNNIAKLAETQRQALVEMEQLRREQAALTATLKAYATHNAQQATLPQPPTMEQILDALQGPMEVSMQNAIETVLVDHRAEVERLLANHNEVLHNGVWSKLSLTLQMTDAIYGWIQHRHNLQEDLNVEDIDRE